MNESAKISESDELNDNATQNSQEAEAEETKIVPPFHETPPFVVKDNAEDDQVVPSSDESSDPEASAESPNSADMYDEEIDEIPETRPIGLDYHERLSSSGVETAPIVMEPATPAIVGINRVEQAKEPTLQAAVRCDLGTRERNEDSCIAFTAESGGHFKMMPFGLYIVADGMGGHTNGHVASRIASRTAANHIFNKIYMTLLQSIGPPTHVPIQEVLIEAVQAANKAVYSDDPQIDSGTTLTIALVLGRRLHVAHVGDSRLYLLNEDKLELVTTDHSLVQRLQDVGQLTAEEATGYRYKHVLLRAVGQVEEVEVDTYMRLLPKTGKLLLCSDGLCGFVAESTLTEVMQKEQSPYQTADDLYGAAMAAHSNDNVTAVVVNLDL